MLEYKLQIAQSFIRIFAGILFFFQGYDKVFKVKLEGVINTFIEDAEHIHVRKYWVTLITYITSYIELLGGFLLILGFFTNYVLLAIGFDLLLVCLAFSIIRPMWDMQYVFPRLVLIITLLFIPDKYNEISLDYLLNIK